MLDHCGVLRIPIFILSVVVPIIEIDEWVPTDHQFELRSREYTLNRALWDDREESLLDSL